MFIDEARGTDKLQVNLDIVFPKAPCDVLSLDAQDVMGNHEVDIHGNMFKYRLSKDGTVLEKIEMQGSHLHSLSSLTRHFSFEYNKEDQTRIKERVKDKEGCRVAGFLRINKVPGNIHVSTHTFFPMMGNLWSDNDSVDLSHRISHLSFGSDEDILHVLRNFRDSGIVAPLDKVERQVPLSDTGSAKPIIYEYYLKIVPTSFELMGYNATHVFQFTANSNQITNSHMPSIYFRYDFSPVTVKFHDEKEENFFQFLIHICAILGGVFSAADFPQSFGCVSYTNLGP
eukprot:GEMP01057872.1.p1 GENE.GEMP01057872.1~~GEMP01057872.1.p1  ORF type:complete len:285 (+),score=46.97 GEMP01057872.1:220-1074(+)